MVKHTQTIRRQFVDELFLYNFSSWIHDRDSHSPDFLDLFLSSDPNIFSVLAFPPYGNSDHVVVSI